MAQITLHKSETVTVIIIMMIIMIIWFGDTVTVSHSTKCNTNSKVRESVMSTLNQIDVFLSALQKYLNQKRKTSSFGSVTMTKWEVPKCC